MYSLLYGWLFFGVIHLCILCYQDIKDKMLVDDRHNWFMLGCTLMFALGKLSFLYLLSVIIISSILFSILNKSKYLGEADLKTVSWLFIGLASIGVFNVMFYFVIYFIVYGLAILIAKYLIKNNKNKIPAYPLFLISFVVYWIIFI